MLQKKTLKGYQGHRQEKEKKLNLTFIFNCYREMKTERKREQERKKKEKQRKKERKIADKIND